jgi:hypothetical protein
MGFKKYLVFGLILIISAGLYVYSLVNGAYAINVAGIHVNLPIAVWVVLPALILYILTVLHFMFYGTLGFFRFRKIKNDSQKFLQNQKRALLGKKLDDNSYKSEVFKLIGAVLPLLNIDPKRYSGYRIYDDGIADILDIKQKVYNGEIVDLSRYNLLPDNALMIKNYENMLEKDKSYAATILKKCTDKALCEKAALAMAEYSPVSELKKFDVTITREILDILIGRMGSENFELSNSEILDYAKELEFDTKDLIELSKKLKDKLNPDERVKFANDLISAFPEIGGEAYLYTMFDLQLIDKARDHLENSAKTEYIKFKHLLFLKDNGKNFDIDLFV